VREILVSALRGQPEKTDFEATSTQMMFLLLKVISGLKNFFRLEIVRFRTCHLRCGIHVVTLHLEADEVLLLNLVSSDFFPSF
jgi:hypothetical protein